jgi:uncharacterized protein (DUF488 family)
MFRALLRQAGVTALADVRSFPRSRHFPHFDEETLKKNLRNDGISYVFLGKELGGRPRDKKLYCDGIADYEKMAEDGEFRKGVARIASGAQTYRVALMCSEHNPLDCHRCLLVGRALSESGITVRHILSNGRQTSQTEIEAELVRLCGHGGDDFFAQGRSRIAEAYRARAKQVSYRVMDLKSAAQLQQDEG